MLSAEVQARIAYMAVDFVSANGPFLPAVVSKGRESVFSLKGVMKQGPQRVSAVHLLPPYQRTSEAVLCILVIQSVNHLV